MVMVLCFWYIYYCNTEKVVLLHNLASVFFFFAELTAIIFLKKALSVQRRKQSIPCYENRRSTTTVTFHAVQTEDVL
jgi:hypothetical protein